MSQLGLLPPATRTPLWREVTAAAARGRLVLPKCKDCRMTQYPPRELCCRCLSPNLQWSEVEASGEVLSFTHLHASLEGFFREHLPWSIAFVKLDSGPCLYAHAARTTAKTGQEVRVMSLLDRSEQAIFLAIPAGDDSEDYLQEFAHLLLPTKT